MCKVKTGSLIKNQEDVQNLIISIINRQDREYSKDRILELAEYYLQGSSLVFSKKHLNDMISRNLDISYRNESISCKNGYYMPQIEFVDLYLKN